MAIRTLTWDVSEDCREVSPAAIQDAGVQGEDGATQVVFRLPAVLQTGFTLHLEYIDSAGGYDTTDELTVADGTVSIDLPLAWTQNGGRATLRLVAMGATEEGMIVYTLEAPIVYHQRQGPWGNIGTRLEETVQGLVRRCRELLETAQKSAQQAAESAEKAEQAAAGMAGGAGITDITIEEA